MNPCSIYKSPYSVVFGDDQFCSNCTEKRVMILLNEIIEVESDRDNYSEPNILNHLVSIRQLLTEMWGE